MDNELLQAIGKMLDDKLAAERIATNEIITRETTPLKSGLAALQNELHEVKGGLHEVRGELHEAKRELRDVKEHVHNMELIKENVTDVSIGIVVESLTGVHAKLDRLVGLEKAQEDHGNRIWALEQAVADIRKALP